MAVFGGCDVCSVKISTLFDSTEAGGTSKPIQVCLSFFEMNRIRHGLQREPATRFL